MPRIMLSWLAAGYRQALIVLASHSRRELLELSETPTGPREGAHWMPTWCLESVLLLLFPWASYAGRQPSRAPQAVP